MRLMNDTIELTPVEEAVVAGKISRVTGTPRRVFGHRSSISQTEFYGSQQAGFELACRVTLWAIDYRGEQRLSCGGTNYRVVRTYDSGDTVELTCEVAEGRGNG